MQRIDIDTVAGLLDGHVDLRRRPGSIQPLRYPFADTLFLDPFTRWVASCSAGVRLRLVSDTRSLRLMATQRSFGERQGNYELYVDGKLRERKPASGGAAIAEGGAVVGDERASIGFEGLAAGKKRLELWLPQTATDRKRHV